MVAGARTHTLPPLPQTPKPLFVTFVLEQFYGHGTLETGPQPISAPRGLSLSQYLAPHT